MKKSLILTVLVLLIALFGGCVKEKEQVGSLALKVLDDEVQAQILLPGLDLTIASYEIRGTGPAGRTFTGTISSTGTLVKDRLAFGDWTIEVGGLNSAGKLVASGSNTAVIHVGQTTDLSITVKPLVGVGKLDLTVNWTASDLENASVTAQLKRPNSLKDLVFDLASGQAHSLTSSIPTGYYTLTVQLLDTGILTMGAVEVVRILTSETTYGIFNFNNINQAGGNISIGITPEMDNPIEVGVIGGLPMLYEGESMTLTVDVPEEIGNVTTVWYLNGEAVAMDQSTYIVEGLSEGVYRMDVTVFSADGQRAGSTTHKFDVMDAVQPTDDTWAKSLEIANRDEGIFDFVRTPWNEYVLGGYCFNIESDFLVTKLNAIGDVVWSKRYVSTGMDVCQALTGTPDNSIIAVGQRTPEGGFAVDACVMKILNTGEIEWVKSYGEALYDESYSLVLDVGDGYIVGGATGCYGEDYTEPYLMKLDQNGNQAWLSILSLPDQNELYSVAQVEGGYLLGVGYTDGYEGRVPMVLRFHSDGKYYGSYEFGGFIGGVLKHISQTNDGGAIICGYMADDYGSTDILLVKMDAAQNPEWAKVYGTMDEEEAYDVKQCDGGYIIGGYSRTPDREREAILLKVDSSGTMQWCTSFGGEETEVVAGVEYDAYGYLAAGDTSSFQPGHDSLVLKTDMAGCIPESSYSRDYTMNMFGTNKAINYRFITPNQMYHSGSLMVDITNQFTAVDAVYTYVEQN